MRTILTFLLLTFSLLGIAQSDRIKRGYREMETLENLYKLKNKEIEEETQAQEKIFRYKNETSEQIRKNISNISNEEYESLSSLQKNLWSQIIERTKLYPSSKKFLSSEISLLNNYREKILNKLFEYVNNPRREQQNLSTNNNLNNCLSDNLLFSELNDSLKNENEALEKQNEALKELNLDLINTLKEITNVTKKGTENLNKSIEIIKQKDLKIKELQEALEKKDSIINR